MTYAAARDPFAEHATSLAAPGRRLIAITPSDSAQLDTYVRALRVAVPSSVPLTDGLAMFYVVAIDTPDDATLTPIYVTQGVFEIPLGVRQVRATGFPAGVVVQGYL